MITGVQILGIVFCIVMMYFTYVYYKRNNYGLRSFLLWTGVWLGALLIVAFPSSVYGIMQALQLNRTADFITLLGFAFFGVITFYMYIIVKKNNRKVEQLVRQIAIEQVKEPKRKK